MKNLTLLDELITAEKMLPSLLKDRSKWNSLFVDYEKPYVERLWIDWEHLRIFLHFLYPCEAADCLKHRHSRPTAVKILSGTYEMGSGHMYEDEFGPVDTTAIYAAGSSYQMVDPDAYHYVHPLELCRTIMIMPKVEAFQRNAPRPTKTLLPLEADKINAMFNYFENYRSK